MPACLGECLKPSAAGVAAADAVGNDLWAWDSVERQWEPNGGFLKGRRYSHTVVSDGRNYYYQVRVREANGLRSAWSNRVYAAVVPSQCDSAFGLQAVSEGLRKESGGARRECQPYVRAAKALGREPRHNPTVPCATRLEKTRLLSAPPICPLTAVDDGVYRFVICSETLLRTPIEPFGVYYCNLVNSSKIGHSL